MRKKLQIMFAGLLVAVFLTACAPFGVQTTNELLRAPTLGAEQAGIQEALAEYLKEEPQYKFPKEGNILSPIIQVDLDGDGVEEGVLFYSVQSNTSQKSRGGNVYMAVLSQTSGEWKVVADVQGSSVDVASVEVVDMMGDGTKQLIVGYSTSNLGSRSLSLYQFKDGQVQEQVFGAYYNYLVGDFTASGKSSIAVVSPATDQVGMRLNFLAGNNGQFEMMQEPVELYQNFVSCIGIYPSVDKEGKQMLIIDGKLPGDIIASQILYFSAEGAGFYTLPDSVVATATNTSRYSSWLNSKDIDGLGNIEIPVETKLVESEDIYFGGKENDTSVSQVDWKDFSVVPEEVKMFGLLDNEYGIFISLPEEWRGTVELKAENDGSWRLVRKQTGALLISEGTVPQKKDANTIVWRIPGSDEMCVMFHRALTQEEKQQISVMILS